MKIDSHFHGIDRKKDRNDNSPTFLLLITVGVGFIRPVFAALGLFFDNVDNLCYHQLTEVNIMDTKKKLIGTRIPESVIIELREYCKLHGILINHFVSEAIKTKLDKAKKSEEKIKVEKLSTN